MELDDSRAVSSIRFSSVSKDQEMGHQGKVMCCDVSPRGRFVVNGGWDRSVRSFGSEEIQVKEEEHVDVKMEGDS